MPNQLIERFIRYIKVETRSDHTSTAVPSTPSQVAFAHQMADELRELGMSDVVYNENNGFVTATLPSNTTEPLPTIGFIAHLDTADFNATDVKPQFHENYQGGLIVLDEAQQIVLSPNDFPNLKNYIGQTLITTDGSTLLGGDDKAGIAEIMTAMAHLIAHPELPHGTIRVAFGPDEEIGRGADLFDVAHFAADFAYTVDGGPVGELQWESFNAALAIVKCQGKNVHPGSAKDKMVNAMTLSQQYAAALPAREVPEHTADREGFYHLVYMTGEVEEAELTYIVRDHDRETFERRKAVMREIAEQINATLDSPRITVDIQDQYYNMGDVLAEDMRPVRLAEKAFKSIGITPIIEPIRGGTDGSKISYMGLPTPNLFIGGENFHGRYEFVSVEGMQLAVDAILAIIAMSASYDSMAKQ